MIVLQELGGAILMPAKSVPRLHVQRAQHKQKKVSAVIVAFRT